MNKEFIIEECEKRISYFFDDKNLLVRALTHSSGAVTPQDSNERMEFLGDAVLGYAVCEMLYKALPLNNEGDLTKVKSAVVSRDSCYKVAQRLDLQEFLMTGKGFGGGQKLPSSLLANAIEAVIAAIYLDGGVEAAKKFIARIFGPEIESLAQDIGAENFKSVLQHLAQKTFGAIPSYLLLDEKGPDHSKCFKIQVKIGSQSYASAWGNNKKEAEQRAAENAICQIRGGEPIYYGGD